MSVEEKIAEWLKQPGTFVTAAEREFIERMRDSAAKGVGYGWMRQVIQWEWEHVIPKYRTQGQAAGLDKPNAKHLPLLDKEDADDGA